MDAVQDQKFSKSTQAQEGAERPDLFDRHLVDLPLDRFNHAVSEEGGARWEQLFEVAVWLKTPSGLAQPLELVLKYRDDAGEHQVFLDRCARGSHRMLLLNGCLSLAFAGRVKAASLALKSVARSQIIVLEEWHLAPQQPKPRSRK